MRVYNNRQLVVLLLLIPIVLLFALLRFIPADSLQGAAVSKRLPVVYELRGAVKQQGLYCFKSLRTIGELIDACGGLKPGYRCRVDAEKTVANASRVIFGEHGPQIEPVAARTRFAFFLPLSVNRASAEELELIPGIGSRTARAIVAYRESRGEIRSLEELLRVKGIGPKRLRALQPLLCVE